MSNYIIQGETLSSIANAIRAKTGSNQTFTPAQMVSAIANISGTSGSDSISVNKDIVYLLSDYINDGNVNRFMMYYYNNSSSSQIKIEMSPCLSSIYSDIFQSNNYISGLSMPECEYIGSEAFYECDSLLSVNFPVCVSIGESAFFSCSDITNAIFPSCEYIGSYAFNECEYLSNISFPACLSIGEMAFCYCRNLSSISFPACLSIGESAFYGCGLLENISFPVCTYIGSGAFGECSSLTAVYFPECTTICESAFYSCSISLFSFPKVTSIEVGAFGYIYNDGNGNGGGGPTFYFMGSSIPSITYELFGDWYEFGDDFGLSIYVPSFLYNDYLSADYWSDYSSWLYSV